MIRPSAPGSGTADRPPGIIDTLQAGFNTLNRSIWLLAIPIAIDLLLWLGPRLSVGMLVEQWLVTAAAPPGIDDGLARSFEEQRRSLLELVRQSEAVRSFNLISLVAIPVLGIPSFRGGAPGIGPAIGVASIPTTLVAALAILLLGLALSALFYGLLGQAVREGRAHPMTYARDFGRLYLWFLVLTALLLVVVLVVGLPLLGLLGTLRLGAPAVVAVLAPLLLGIALWVYFYVFFTTDALFVARVPPGKAIQHSIMVVRYNFWSTLGFIALIMVISAGFPILWFEVDRGFGTPGVAIAVVGHIYISTGLAAASMTYYKERFQRLRSS
jgi:hypothetical protein